jgi:hypothetical protein
MENVTEYNESNNTLLMMNDFTVDAVNWLMNNGIDVTIENIQTISAVLEEESKVKSIADDEIDTRESFEIMGYTDAMNTCCRCGKQNLKGTYVVKVGACDFYYLGSSCVKKAWQMTQKELNEKIDNDEDKRIALAKAELKNHPDYDKFIKYKSNSAERRADMKKGGLSLVCKKTKSIDDFKAILIKKYSIKSAYRLSVYA